MRRRDLTRSQRQALAVLGKGPAMLSNGNRRTSTGAFVHAATARQLIERGLVRARGVGTVELTPAGAEVLEQPTLFC